MEEVCRADVRKESMLFELAGERFYQVSANRRPEARLNLSTNGFWTPGKRIFLDLRVFDLQCQMV